MGKKIVSTVESKGTSKGSKGKKAPAVVIPTKMRKGKNAPVVITSHANGADYSETRPGVLGFFVESLLKAHGKGGLTKKALLALACEKFPERVEAQMKSTIAMQLPSGFYIEKGYVLTVNQGETGRAFSLSPEAKFAGDAWRLAKRTQPDIARPAKGESDE